MGSTSPGAVVLDAGALVAFERNDRRVRRLVELAADHGRRLHVPAGAIGQVWRDGARQARLARLVKSGVLDVRALDLDEARAAGVACGLSGTADVIDASVAILARRHGAIVVTSDPADLRRLDSGLTLVVC
ncbi:MAG: PIN domain nuclease [Actinomycetota bacterium]|nr:PIN domain nuclease [Actinomycetota bacterium]